MRVWVSRLCCAITPGACIHSAEPTDLFSAPASPRLRPAISRPETLAGAG